MSDNAAKLVVVALVAVSCFVGFEANRARQMQVPATEAEKKVAEVLELYKTGEGALMADPVYPTEKSIMGLVWVRYRITFPDVDATEQEDRMVPVLRDDDLKNGDKVIVECFFNKKDLGYNFVIIARPDPSAQ